ncbi:MAG: type II toxin-antitoxin system RelE/ParE family toxin [Pirellulales bacterium]
MPRFVVSPSAAADIEDILAHTLRVHGEAALLRYEALLVRAIADVAAAPDRPGVHTREEIASAARTYHLANSCENVDREIGRVKRPRHFLLFRLRGDGTIEIGRVLHESMDLARHLPDAYRTE